MSWVFMHDEKPLSVNSSVGKKKERYKALLRKKLSERYPGFAMYGPDERLYFSMTYFVKEKRADRDIDNIIKPAIDSLNEFLYPDDKQIGMCRSQLINCTDNTLQTINLNQMDAFTFTELNKMVNDPRRRRLTRIEVGVMRPELYEFNIG